MTETIYRCPRTARPLLRRGNALETRDGTSRYRVRRRVPDFRLAPPSHALDEQELTMMVSLAARDGWRAGIARVRPELLAQVDDAARAMFLDLLPLPENSTVLEIGCGLGQVLVALSGRVRHVHGLELSPGLAQFAAERCRQSGCDNVYVAAGGDDLLLPYADGAFSAVVLNHVFEWVRVAGDSQATRTAQSLLLREIRRVLAPGGVLFLGTRNRYGLRLLLGGRDESARDLRFGHALPRRLVRTLAAGRPGILGMPPSYGELEALLRDAGFETLRSFWGAPDGRYPKRFVATDTAAIRGARRIRNLAQGPTLATRLLMPLVPAPLVKYVTPGLIFIARSPARVGGRPRLASSRRAS